MQRNVFWIRSDAASCRDKTWVLSPEHKRKHPYDGHSCGAQNRTIARRRPGFGRRCRSAAPHARKLSFSGLPRAAIYAGKSVFAGKKTAPVKPCFCYIFGKRFADFRTLYFAVALALWPAFQQSSKAQAIFDDERVT